MTTTATPAADTGLSKEAVAASIGDIHPRLPKWREIINLDDAANEATNLALVLDATFDIIREMDYGRPDGSRNRELDNVSALVQTAQGLAEYLAEAIDRLPRKAAVEASA